MSLDNVRAAAVAAEAVGRHAEAAEYWRQLVSAEHRPEDALSLGTALAATGDDAGAVEALQWAATQAPDMAEPHFKLGWIHEKHNRLEDAKMSIQRGLSVKTWPPGFTMLGRVCRRLGDDDSARAAFQQAMQLDPSDDEATSGLAIVERFHDPECAISLFRRALRLNPESAVAHRELGHMLWRVGQLAERQKPRVSGVVRLEPNIPGDSDYLEHLLRLERSP